MLVRYIHHYNVCLWRVDWLGHVIILRDYIILRIVLIKYYKSIFIQEHILQSLTLGNVDPCLYDY